MTAEPALSAVSSRPDATIVSTQTFTLVKVPPPVELRGLVLDIALYRETSGKPIRQIETASLVVPMLIGFAEPFEIALGRPPTAGEGYHSFTSGLCLTPVNIASAGACSCLEITLTPLGARRFFGVPMSEMRERMIHLDDLQDRSLVNNWAMNEIGTVVWPLQRHSYWRGWADRPNARRRLPGRTTGFLRHAAGQA